MGFFHEAVPAVLFDLGADVVGQGVGPCPCDVLVLEAADAVELRFIQPVEQVLEFFFGFTRIADDEGGAQGNVGADGPPCADFVEGFGPSGGPCHAFQDVWVRVLERDVEVGQDA